MVRSKQMTKHLKKLVLALAGGSCEIRLWQYSNRVNIKTGDGREINLEWSGTNDLFGWLTALFNAGGEKPGSYLQEYGILMKFKDDEEDSKPDLG